MKKRTIEKVLQTKFFDFVSSIKDENVKELVTKNSFISGGCIVSMLLKEKVHDYDIYFTNKETVLAVSKYYASLFKKAKAEVVDVDSIEDETKRTYFQLHGISGTGRVAIYCDATKQVNTPNLNNDEEQVEELTSVILEELTSVISEEKDEDEKSDEKYCPLYLSPNAISLSNKIQLIIRFYGSPEEVHVNYDFVHTTNYWTPQNGLVFNQAALESILTKELIYVGSKYPIASILRCRKFIMRGWTINAGQLLKIMYQISKLNLDDIATLEDQLVGVDVVHFTILINAIRSQIEKYEKENTPFLISYNYLSKIIDKVFNSNES